MRCNFLQFVQFLQICAVNFVCRANGERWSTESNLDLELELEQIGGNCYNGRI